MFISHEMFHLNLCIYFFDVILRKLAIKYTHKYKTLKIKVKIRNCIEVGGVNNPGAWVRWLL